MMRLMYFMMAQKTAQYELCHYWSGSDTLEGGYLKDRIRTAGPIDFIGSGVQHRGDHYILRGTQAFFQTPPLSGVRLGKFWFATGRFSIRPDAPIQLGGRNMIVLVDFGSITGTEVNTSSTAVLIGDGRYADNPKHYSNYVSYRPVRLLVENPIPSFINFEIGIADKGGDNACEYFSVNGQIVETAIFKVREVGTDVAFAPAGIMLGRGFANGYGNTDAKAEIKFYDLKMYRRKADYK